MKIDDVLIKSVTKSNWGAYKKGIIDVEKIFDNSVDTAQIKRIVFTKRSICLIALYRGGVIGALYGMSSASYGDSDFTSNDDDTYYLGSIGVLPEFQGGGVGSKLRSELMEIAKKENYKFIEEHSLKPEGIPRCWVIIKKEAVPNWINDESAVYFKFRVK